MWKLAVILLFTGTIKAFVDTLDHHFDTSIFKKLPRKWFDPNVIVKTSPVIFKYPVDAWHIGNSFLFGIFILLPNFYQSITGSFALDWTIMYLYHVLWFNIFYNKIFKIENKN